MDTKSGQNGGRGDQRPAPFFRAPVTWGILGVVAAATTLSFLRQPAEPSYPPSSATPYDQSTNSVPSGQPGSFRRHGQKSSAPSHPDDFLSNLDPNDRYAAEIVDVDESVPNPADAEATLALEEARKLVASLVTFEFEPGLSTPEALKRWQDNLARLVDGGIGSVPAISELLSRMQDIDFANIPETAGIGHATLRLALVDALSQIGGSESEGALLAALKQTADPREIASLARTLNELSPGAHREDVLSASREAFQLMQSGQLPGHDAAPLYEVFRTFGSQETAEELLQSSSNWPHYALVAAAGMPSGSGLPILIAALENPDATPAGLSDFGFRLLAQSAVAYPEAGRALIQQAATGRIPTSAWDGIAEALSGYETRLQSAILDEGMPALQGGSSVRSYHLSLGEQNYYTAPVSSMPPSEIEDRLALIDQLLGMVNDPGSLAGLRSQRERLVSLQTPP